MTLQQSIKESIKEAMKARDTVRLSVLRGISSALTNHLVATNRTPQSELADDEVLEVISKEAKRRKDSIEQFIAGGRQDLAVDEQAELEVLQSFLPQQMSLDEIKPIAEAKKAELGIDDKSKIGILVGALMKDLKGKADGNDVKQAVESLFN